MKPSTFRALFDRPDEDPTLDLGPGSAAATLRDLFVVVRSELGLPEGYVPPFDVSPVGAFEDPATVLLVVPDDLVPVDVFRSFRFAGRDSIASRVPVWVAVLVVLAPAAEVDAVLSVFRLAGRRAVEARWLCAGSSRKA